MPRITSLTLLYALTAKLVLAFFSANGVVSMVWPPSGLALGALLLGGRRYWPGVFFGALAGNVIAGSPAGLSFAIAIGNTLEALAGFWLLTHKDDFDVALTRPRHFLRLAQSAALSATLAAGVGTAALLAAGVLTVQTFPINLLQWWQGDLLGILLVTPLILVWSDPPKNGFGRRNPAEMLLFLVMTVLCGQAVFFGWFQATLGSIARGYWMFLFVAWAAVRFGRHGVLLVLALTAVQALAGAALGTGFFGTDIAQTGLENFWFYMLVLTLTGMSLAAVIAERTHVERQLRHEKQLSDDIINSLPGVFYILDNQGRFVRWNERFQRLSGYAAAEMAGMPALNTIGADQREIVAQRIGEVFANGEAEVEASLLHKDGTTAPYRFTGRRTELDGRAYLVGLGEDISARKQAEDEIRRLNTAYATLSEINQIIVRLHSADELYARICHVAVEFGGYIGAWVGVADPQTQRIVPVAMSGVVDDYIRNITISTDAAHPEGRGPTALALRTGHPYFCQDYLSDPITAPWHEFGQRFGVRASTGLPLQRNGVTIGVLTLYAGAPNHFDTRMQALLEELAGDVSFALDNFDREAARAHAEAEVLALNRELDRRVQERTAELAAANKNLEAFSYSVSHDLRAPLRAINGFSHLLVDGEHDNLSADGKVMLDRIAHNAVKLGQLIDDILEYSRAGRLELKHDVIDLNALAHKTANDLHEAYPSVEFRIAALPHISGDATMLRQILTNLVGNACKYSSKREKPVVEIGTLDAQGETVFFVRDNGAGFDMRYTDKLFGMFQRLHKEADFPGSGVGLAIVKRLIERHGGEIWAEAEVDQGATFYFKLGAQQ